MKIKKYILIFTLLLTLNFYAFVYAKVETDTDLDGLSDYEEQNVYKTYLTIADTDSDGYNDGHEVYNGYSPTQNNYIALSKVELSVPYVEEAPDGNWTGPWKNACEESAMAMVEYYYLANRNYNLQKAKDYMWNLFTQQDKIYGSNADSDSVRTAYLINNFSVYWAERKINPTLDDIKKALQQKRPVITFHYGFDLKNPNIPFLSYGSSYHVMVVIGYDDDKKEFIVNDPGDTKTGDGYRYGYDLFLNTLSDFNYSTGLSKGNTPTVIFTYPRLVTPFNSDYVYYLDINDKTISLVSDSHNLSNSDMIMTVEPQFLSEFKSGNPKLATDIGQNAKTNISNNSSYSFTSYLYLGSSGEEVRQLQLKLKSLGHYTHSQITGYFGLFTQEAVVKFQKANNLAPYPGWVGPQTRTALNK